MGFPPSKALPYAPQDSQPPLTSSLWYFCEGEGALPANGRGLAACFHLLPMPNTEVVALPWQAHWYASCSYGCGGGGDGGSDGGVRALCSATLQPDLCTGTIAAHSP